MGCHRNIWSCRKKQPWFGAKRVGLNLSFIGNYFLHPIICFLHPSKFSKSNYALVFFSLKSCEGFFGKAVTVVL